MNNRPKSYALALVAVLVMLISAPAAAEMCLAANPNGSAIDVRNGPDGKSLGQLPNGTKVFKRGFDWGQSGPVALVAGEYQGKWRDFGYVPEDHINCGNVADESPYPLIFSSANQLRELGVALRNYGPEQPADFANKCFYYGDGGYDMSLSKKMVKRYTSKGMSLDNLCMVLRVSNLRFDPETGQRLPTYMVVDMETLEKYGPEGGDPFTLSGELPLHVPPCFSNNAEIVKNGPTRTMRFGCVPRYDPWSGVKLSDVEIAYYKTDVVLMISGEAGPSAAPADAKLALTDKKRATKASVKSVLDFWE